MGALSRTGAATVMANLTLIVIGKSTEFDMLKVHHQWQAGDILDVLLTKNLGRVAPAPRTKMLWIKITGVPAGPEGGAKRRAGFMVKHYWSPVLNEWDAPMLARRRWRIPLQDLPAGIKQKLRDDRHVTVTWTQAKAFIRDHVDMRLIEDADFA